jgi:hypothetical protein
MQAEGCQRGRARAMLPKTNFPNNHNHGEVVPLENKCVWICAHLLKIYRILTAVGKRHEILWGVVIFQLIDFVMQLSPFLINFFQEVIFSRTKFLILLWGLHSAKQHLVYLYQMECFSTHARRNYDMTIRLGLCIHLPLFYNRYSIKCSKFCRDIFFCCCSRVSEFLFQIPVISGVVKNCEILVILLIFYAYAGWKDAKQVKILALIIKIQA